MNLKKRAEREPFTLEEFRGAMPELEDDVLRPLLNICNKAVENGLTRQQVKDTLADLTRAYPPPAPLPVDVLIQTLGERVYPDG